METSVEAPPAVGRVRPSNAPEPGVRQRLNARLTRWQPPDRADQADVTFPEDFQVVRGEGESGKKLITLIACEQVIVPDYSQVAFSALNAHAVSKATIGVAADLAGAKVLHESILQAAADIVA